MKNLYILAVLLIFTLNAACPNSKSNNANNAANPMNSANNEIKNGVYQTKLPKGFEQPTEDVGRRLLKEYGAVFVASGGAVAPKTVIFKNEQEVSAFQTSIEKSAGQIGAHNLELQTAAMNALKEAINEAKQNDLTITARGADSAKRTYSETVELWASRVNPGLVHWVSKGKLSQTEADRIKGLSPFAQVSEIFKLEAQGMFFAKDLSKSIIYSVAPPGTSQHLSMLALDVTENESARVREILAKHGWYQTVQTDLPHFTYLGVKEDELSSLGLKKVSSGGRTFWLPNI